MRKHNTKQRRNKIGAEASHLLRAERGALSLIARKIGVSRQTVSRVARGEKTSERVRVAIVRYLLARGRELGTAAFLIEHAGRR
jgi:nicotinate-nucleotide pyrophosphorylase